MANILPGTIACLLEPQDFAYNTGVTLRGYSATRKGNDWQVIFRGISRTGENVYCLFVAVDLDSAWEGLFSSICNKGGSRYWYPDKYAR